jgi:STAS domain-containing protein
MSCAGPAGLMPRRQVDLGGMDLGARRDRPCLVLPGPIRRSDVSGLCDRALDLMAGRPDEALECDVGRVGHPDLLTVEALSRIGLVARRQRTGIRLRGASVDLIELLAFCGLPVELVVEGEWEPEQREEARRVEEERDPRDPVA